MPNWRALKGTTYSTVTTFGGTRVGARVAAAVDSLDRAFRNDSADSGRNGEVWLLDQLIPVRPTVVFDVGANVGAWSAEALRRLDRATVHAFEPIPSTFARLAECGDGGQRLVTNQLALTSTDGPDLTMWKGSHSTVASAVRRSATEGSEVSVPSMRGDTYCGSAGVDRIDLLKVDVEGHDLAVLRGFSGMLEARRIDIVQFEFTLFAVFARVWLSDFHELLGEFGYAVGKLYPSWIDWSSYDASDERHLRCNFVAAVSGTPAAAAIGRL